MNISSWLPIYQKRVNDALSRFFANRYSSDISWVKLEFVSALRHAVEWWGKRIRPILAMMAYEQTTGKECSDEILDGFLGLELMHCFTLVHDDLPCMDNDSLRRGQPTVWKKYGETMAILVGDTLQTLSFELLSNLDNIEIIREFSLALGDRWVILWQVRDTLEDQSDYSLADIMSIHDEKTGGFIASCLVIWWMVAWADSVDIEKFRKYGILLGRAFQVRDDILDVEGESSLIGKTVWKDSEQNKWLVALVGIDETKKILQHISEELDGCFVDSDNQKLKDIQKYVVKREK